VRSFTVVSDCILCLHENGPFWGDTHEVTQLFLQKHILFALQVMRPFLAERTPQFTPLPVIHFVVYYDYYYYKTYHKTVRGKK